MSQSLSQLYLHIIFSTKNRIPFLTNLELRVKLHAYLSGICKNLESPSLSIGGVADHVHLLCRFSKNLSVATFVRDLKRESSKWIKSQDAKLTSFYWQQGYGAFSISPGHVEGLIEYIRNQESHHKTESFQDELRRLCRKYGLELNEDYCWD